LQIAAKCCNVPASDEDGMTKPRTLAIGDIHGDIAAVRALFRQLPNLTAADTIVLLGDYLDRGPHSAQVVDFIRRELPTRTQARIVALRGNHEDAWLRVIDRGWPEFILPPWNGCLACLRSFRPTASADKDPAGDEDGLLLTGGFFPPDVVAWMRSLPHWYEDEHAIYVHAGLPKLGDRWLHPSEVEEPQVLLWTRSRPFFSEYRGKLVVCGHTTTPTLPAELSSFTPEDPTDLWAGEAVYAIDTACGKGGFLTAIELPAAVVYESR
jgi:serine/threonine protein phosphatase 1